MCYGEPQVPFIQEDDIDVIVINLSLPPWWRHQMETLSALLALCEGNSPVTNEIPSQRPVARRFDVFSDLRLNKRLSKQTWGWWFETPSRSLWRHCNELQSCIASQDDSCKSRLPQSNECLFVYISLVWARGLKRENNILELELIHCHLRPEI